MKELFDKISSYNIFNYLFPGVIFVVISTEFTSYSFIQDNLIVGVFIYYFIGLVISRFGSLTIEPFLKSISFLKFVEYKDYVDALKKDPQINLLSEANNMYRTLSSMLFLLLLVIFYDRITTLFQLSHQWDIWIFIIILLIMFLFSYRKQTSYIRKRVSSNKL